MEIIINPKVAYLLIFTGVMLLLTMFNDTKYSFPKVGAMAFCILAGIAEFFMLTIGSAYLFVDENRRPLVNLGLAGMVSIFGGLFIWLIIQRAQTAGKSQLIGDTLVGMTGEVWIAIEPFSIGSVRIEGEFWQARSKEMLSAGTLVRVIRQEGITLTVKKIENIKAPNEK